MGLAAAGLLGVGSTPGADEEQHSSRKILMSLARDGAREGGGVAGDGGCGWLPLPGSLTNG